MIEQQSQEQVVGRVPPTAVGTAGALATQAMDLSTLRTRARLRPDERAFLWVSRVIVWVSILVVLIPLVLVAMASVTPGNAFFVSSVIPNSFSWEHFYNVFNSDQVTECLVGGSFCFTFAEIAVWMINSAIVCISTAVISVILVAFTGYAFSRFHFRGRKYGLMSLLLIQMFPAQMAFVALYFLLNYIGLFNTLWGLILVFLGGGIPFNAWLFKGYVDGLPRDLEESAYVDGATRFQAFWKVILPLTRPMMAVIFIFQTIGIYNDYILTNYLINDPGHLTIAVGLRTFINGQFGQHWNDFAAGAIIAAIPITVIFLAAQKWLVSGLAAGAVKG